MTSRGPGGLVGHTSHTGWRSSVLLRATRATVTVSRWPALAPLLAVTLLFVLTRIALLVLTIREREFVMPSVTNDVRFIYRDWYDVLATGQFPQDDVMWQYPPAAALVMLAPALLPLTYAVSFYWISFAVDLLTFAVLLAAAHRVMHRSGPEQAATAVRSPRAGTRRAALLTRRQPWAAWVWTLGVALGGPINYGRYDLMVTGVAVCGLVLLGGRAPETLLDNARAGRRRLAGGALLAFGAMLKVWPALLLLAAGPGRRWRQAWVGAAGSAALIAVGFALVMPHSWAFLSAQGGRGVEIESLGALPFHLAVHHGWDGQVALSYGSMEYLGPWVRPVAVLCLLTSVAALLWLVCWRLTARRWRAATTADAALVAVLLFVVTSRMISPQYMVWLVGLAAVCALHFGTGRTGTEEGSLMRLPVVLVLIATALTCVEFPYYFPELMAAERDAVVLVTVRNLLLVGAGLIGARRLWRSTRAVAPVAPTAVRTALPGPRAAPVGADQQRPTA